MDSRNYLFRLSLEKWCASNVINNVLAMLRSVSVEIIFLLYLLALQAYKSSIYLSWIIFIHIIC